MKTFNIESLFYFILFICLFGCDVRPVNSNSEIVNSSFVIFGSNKSLTTHTQLSNGILTLGDIEIKNWPLSNLECSPCEITLDRRFHPDGPTSWLIVENKNKTKTWIISSFQKKIVIGNWQLNHNNDQVLITDTRSNEETNVPSNIHFLTSLDSERNCSINWSKKELLDQPGKHIAADIAEFKSQFIIQCEYHNTAP